MNQKLIAEIGKSQRLAILNKLKRTQGLPVRQLADLLDMSYMGIKQHCIELHKEGYLETWRHAKPVGRPEMLYRLTDRAQELFPSTSNEITIHILQAAQKLYGVTAAEKLLFSLFQGKTANYLAKVKGGTVAEKAKKLAKLRDQEGYMAGLESNGSAMRIVEFHSPMLDLMRAYPIVARLEGDLYQRVLETPVTREEQLTAGPYHCVFHISAR
jgi:predicted ArsR family transcriptional regulator